MATLNSVTESPHVSSVFVNIVNSHLSIMDNVVGIIGSYTSRNFLSINFENIAL